MSKEFNIKGLRSTIYDLKQQKDKILSFHANSDVPELMHLRKTVQQAKSTNVEKVLMEWIRQQHMKNFPLDQATIMFQTRKFHSQISSTTHFEYSSGRFTKFKWHYGLRLLKFSSEKAYVEGTKAYFEEISELINQENLTKGQIYNAHETLLFWHYMPKINKGWLF